MKKIIVNNPAIETFLSNFRDVKSSIYDCNICVENMSFFLAGEISNLLERKKVNIKTPLGSKRCNIINEEVVLVPIMRAGMSMLSGFQRIIPKSSVGFIWAHRNTDAKAEVDTFKFPSNMENKTIIILDTMLATAGTINSVVDVVLPYNPKQVIVASILATEYGINNISEKVIALVAIETSDTLNEKLYIYPGVGDSGDRLYG